MRGKTSPGGSTSTTKAHSFNEAPAECGGKPRSCCRWCPRWHCFNEAPAECGGKRCRSGRRPRGRRASMRPPQNAGENGERLLQAPAQAHCFNEAPAECGGKPRRPICSALHWTRFNEAPAECGGKRRRSRTASARRRRFNEAPAECGGKRAQKKRQAGEQPASMRPPQNAGENASPVALVTMHLAVVSREW